MIAQDHALATRTRCGTTNGERCWRASLRARRSVDHWCDDVNKHLGACVCAGCGDIIATRRMMPVPRNEVYAQRARAEREAVRAEREAVDATTIPSSNAEIPWPWILFLLVRTVGVLLGVTHYH